jgi:hypothetical protein
MVSLAILTFGLLGLLALLQRTLQKSEPVEFESRGNLLANSILEGLRSHPEGGFPFVPGLNPTTWPVIPRGVNIYSQGILQDKNGDPYQLTTIRAFVFNIPGNAVDDDAFLQTGNMWTDAVRWVNGNVSEAGRDGIDDPMYQALRGVFGSSTLLRDLGRRDFDSGAQQEVAFILLNGAPITSPADSDQDGYLNDSGDSSTLNGAIYNGVFGYSPQAAYRPDGDFSYDPQRNLDEEISDGRDNDGDGLIDEDLTLSSQLRSGGNPLNPYDLYPLLPGNGLDDDNDGENAKTNKDTPSPRDPLTGKIIADEIDNDGDGQIDEGIDEEIYDGRDNDGDGRIDEDCQGAYLPWQPIPFPSPNEDYSFRIMVRRVSVGGDGVDNDGDAAYGTRSVTVNGTTFSITQGSYDVNGDGVINQKDNFWIDEEFFDGADNDGDGLTDEDLRAYPSPLQREVVVLIYQGDDRKDSDGDNWIDEEARDGIDNDLDGRTDEDNYRRIYQIRGIIELAE